MNIFFVNDNIGFALGGLFMGVKTKLIEKRNELVEKNNLYNENLSLIRNLTDEIEKFERTKETRISKIRLRYWIICSILILLQNIIDLGGIQHSLALMGICINGFVMINGTTNVINNITKKKEELSTLEKDNNDLFEVVFALRSEVHDLALQVEKLTDNYLSEDIKEVIEEVNNFEIQETYEEPVRKMLSLY